VRSATEDAVPYFPAGAGRVSAATVETAIKLKTLIDVPIMLEEEEGGFGEDLSYERGVMCLFDHGKEQNEDPYIQTECAILVGSIDGHCP
jgi:hypothetical protein